MMGKFIINDCIKNEWMKETQEVIIHVYMYLDFLTVLYDISIYL